MTIPASMEGPMQAMSMAMYTVMSSNPVHRVCTEEATFSSLFVCVCVCVCSLFVGGGGIVCAWIESVCGVCVCLYFVLGLGFVS